MKRIIIGIKAFLYSKPYCYDGSNKEKFCFVYSIEKNQLNVPSKGLFSENE